MRGANRKAPPSDAAGDVGMLLEPSGFLAVPGSQPSPFAPFTDWTHESKRRLDAQLRAMRHLQAGENVPVSAMVSAGGHREYLARCANLDPTPPLEPMPRKMEWFRKAARESFWTLPPHLEQDLAALSSTTDSSETLGAGRRTLAGERRWRAEQRMCQMEEQLEREYAGGASAREQAHPAGISSGFLHVSSLLPSFALTLPPLALHSLYRSFFTRSSLFPHSPLHPPFTGSRGDGQRQCTKRRQGGSSLFEASLHSAALTGFGR